MTVSRHDLLGHSFREQMDCSIIRPVHPNDGSTQIRVFDFEPPPHVTPHALQVVHSEKPANYGF